MVNDCALWFALCALRFAFCVLRLSFGFGFQIGWMLDGRASQSRVGRLSVCPEKEDADASQIAAQQPPRASPRQPSTADRDAICDMRYAICDNTRSCVIFSSVRSCDRTFISTTCILHSMDFLGNGPMIGAVIPHKSAVSSLSYHADGVHLFAATEADSKLYLINTQSGRCDQPAFKCEREGISFVSSTHHDHCVLFAGGKGSSAQQNAIHYWSLYDNKILRKFRGHSGTITDLSMCPAEDMFLTASQDRTVRLWNVQSAGCMAQLSLPSNTSGQPHCVFDKTGLVFAIMAAMSGGQGHYIHLYDARNFSGGAFSEMQLSSDDLQKAMVTQRVAVPPSEPIAFKSINFNLSGNRMLVQADPGLAVVLDGYEGTVQRVFQSAQSKGTSSCFTPDDQYVLMGTESGGIDCWNVQSGTIVKQLEGHSGPVGALKCNPKYSQIASSCSNTCLWIW